MGKQRLRARTILTLCIEPGSTCKTIGSNMDRNRSFYCSVLDQNGQSKFVCYTWKTSGIFNIGLTNATEVWSTDITEEKLGLTRQKGTLTSTEDYILKIRSACK